MLIRPLTTSAHGRRHSLRAGSSGASSAHSISEGGHRDLSSAGRHRSDFPGDFTLAGPCSGRRSSPAAESSTAVSTSEVQLLWGRPAPAGRAERLDSAPRGRNRGRGNARTEDGRVISAGGHASRCYGRRPPRSNRRAPRSTSTWSTGARGCSGIATYSVTFKATYTFRNPDAEARELRVRFPLPAEDALFDDFVFTLDGRPAQSRPATSRRR